MNITLGRWARRTGFWLLDGIKGGQIGRHYDDIRSKLSTGADSHDQLQLILDHATRTTPFYSRYSSNDLQDLPVATKAMYKNAFNDFQSNAYVGAPLYPVSTSGSSGMPFAMGQDAVKRSRVVAEVLYFNDICGYRLGDRLIWLRAWSTVPSKSRMARFAQNIIPIDLASMDDSVKKNIVLTLRRQRVNCILGYSSALWSLARYIDDEGYDGHEFGLRVVISDSESLQPTIKRRLESAFGCPVVDRYANAENGILGCTKPRDDVFHLNSASYYFEFLKLSSNDPEDAGSLARIIVTDLYGYAMPMIRYDTGDLAIVADNGPGQPRTLHSLDGRSADGIYDVGGRRLSSTYVGGLMGGFADIAQWQLVQEDASTYRIRVSMANSTYDATDFESKLKPAFGSDARVVVEFVESIPSEPNGKFRSTICKYAPLAKGASA